MKNAIKDSFEIVISKAENSFYNKKYRFIKIHNNFLYLKLSKDLTISDLNKNYIVIIYGYIENFNIKKIFDIVNKSDIDDYIKVFNGKFVLFIIDKINGTSKVYSDRLNSKNIFLFINNDNFIYSNNIYNFKRFNLTINEGALGFYLSNGYLIGESTLFNEIETFSYALNHIINKNKIKRKKYWNFSFTYKNENNKKSKLEELDSLLFKSVNKNVSKVENLISLSGGYDSSAILGYMKKNKSNLNINCFNYFYGKIFSLSDMDIARKTCLQNGIKLKEYKMYSSGILNNLKLNAIAGQGIANICDEIDCIEKINRDIKYNASMFFGDEVFGTDDELLVNKKDVLKSLRIYDFNNLKFMKNFIISNKLSSIEKQSFLFYKKLFKVKNNNLSSFDLKQIYYYQYRVTCVLSRWRDLFYSSYFDYYNPLLDNNIIDFIKNLSFKDRKDRKLFIKTIKNNNKNIFNKIPRAKFPNKISDKEYYSKLVNEIKSENYFPNMTSTIKRYIDLKKLEFKINNLSLFNFFNLNKFQYYSRRLMKKSKILKFIFYKISFFNIEYVALLDFTKRVIVLDNIFKKMELDK